MSPNRPHGGTESSSSLAKLALVGAASFAIDAAVSEAQAGVHDYALNTEDLETQYGVDLTSMVGGDQSRVWGVAGDLADSTSPIAVSVDMSGSGLPDTVDLSLNQTGSWNDITSDFTGVTSPAISSYSSTQDKLLALDFGGVNGYMSVGGYGSAGAKTSLDTYTGPSTIGSIDDPTGDVYGSDDVGSGLKPYLFTGTAQAYQSSFDLPAYEEEGFFYNSDSQIGAFTDHATGEVIIVDYSGATPDINPTGVIGWVSDPQPGSFKVQLASDFSWHELRDPTYGVSSPTDADGDGSALPDDCDDADATVYPGATDPASDGVAQDCVDDAPTASLMINGVEVASGGTLSVEQGDSMTLVLSSEDDVTSSSGLITNLSVRNPMGGTETLRAGVFTANFIGDYVVTGSVVDGAGTSSVPVTFTINVSAPATDDTGVPDDTGTPADDTAAPTDDTGDSSGETTACEGSELVYCVENGRIVVNDGELSESGALDSPGDSVTVTADEGQTVSVPVAVDGMEELLVTVTSGIAGIELGIDASGGMESNLVAPPSGDEEARRTDRAYVLTIRSVTATVQVDGQTVLPGATKKIYLVPETKGGDDTGVDDTGLDDTGLNDTELDDTGVDSGFAVDSGPEVHADTGADQEPGGCACASTELPGGSTVTAGFLLGLAALGRRKRA